LCFGGRSEVNQQHVFPAFKVVLSNRNYSGVLSSYTVWY